jgi:ketosteroid isomerase-like protein
MSSAEQAEALQAAADLVARFGAHDVQAYFAAFAPDATFIFHSTPEILYSRDAYEELWHTWETRDKFRVLSCRSTEPRVTVHGETAIFTHRVETRLAFGPDETTANERETIVFRRQENGGWLAIHEHLSPADTLGQSK